MKRSSGPDFRPSTVFIKLACSSLLENRTNTASRQSLLIANVLTS